MRNSGSFRRRSLAAPRPRRKPLEKKEESPLMQKLRAQTPDSVRLDRQGFRSAPKPKELPPGFIYCKAAAIGDRIACPVDGDNVLVGEVLVTYPHFMYHSK